MNVETTTRQGLRFVALAQGPDEGPRLRFPTTFNLGIPTAYYQAVVLPRR